MARSRLEPRNGFRGGKRLIRPISGFVDLADKSP